MDELEFPAGTSDEAIRNAERDFRKDAIARTFNWTRQQLDLKLESLKEFLTDEETVARKQGRTTISNKRN